MPDPNTTPAEAAPAVTWHARTPGTGAPIPRARYADMLKRTIAENRDGPPVQIESGEAHVLADLLQELAAACGPGDRLGEMAEDMAQTVWLRIVGEAARG